MPLMPLPIYDRSRRAIPVWHSACAKRGRARQPSLPRLTCLYPQPRLESPALLSFCPCGLWDRSQRPPYREPGPSPWTGRPR
jgi:hypothetical protein